LDWAFQMSWWIASQVMDRIYSYHRTVTGI